MPKKETAPTPKRCFVVMGFGIKTDYATGRKLDLNKSYRLLIKPVVEGKGLICIRADEIRHSGAIDTPMYQELLNADVVIADLSTANVNAFYELGIRHALRPFTTIVVSEDKLAYPFDLNHIKITNYTHLGDAIDYEEVERFRKELGETLEAVLHNQQPDSPVYTFLNELTPPLLKRQMLQAAEAASKEAPKAKPKKEKQKNETLALLIQGGENAIKEMHFSKAREIFHTAYLIGKDESGQQMVSNDPYLVHRLALATYKAAEPDAITALYDALALLQTIDLAHTNDPETVALAGAIEKRLFESGEGDVHISRALLYYQRGYYLLNNRYNGINLAFMLNCRAHSSLCKTREDKIADMVWANRTRREVLRMCEEELDEIEKRESRTKIKIMQMDDDDVSSCQYKSDIEHKFWTLVNKAEAHFGLGELEAYESAVSGALQLPHDAWMMATFKEQVKKLKGMLLRNGDLLNPAWPAHLFDKMAVQ